MVDEKSAYEGGVEAVSLDGGPVPVPVSDTWGNAGWYGSLGDLRECGGRLRRRGFGVRRG